MCRSPTFKPVCPALPAHAWILLISQIQSLVGVEMGVPRKPCHLWDTSQRPVAASPGDGQGSGRLWLPWSGLPHLDQKASWVECSCCGGCPVHPSRCPLEAKHTLTPLR